METAHTCHGILRIEKTQKNDAVLSKHSSSINNMYYNTVRKCPNVAVRSC